MNDVIEAERVLMKCGCVAHATCKRRGDVVFDPPIPACVIHECYEVADSKPDLTGRKASCSYRPAGHADVPSSYDLAFFEYRGPGSPEATAKCKCGMHESTHWPRWRVEIKYARRWYSQTRVEDVRIEEGHARDEAEAKLWAEAMRVRWLTWSPKDSETEVLEAEISSLKQIRNHHKCRKFVPHGPHATDNYYCGCHGWD